MKQLKHSLIENRFLGRRFAFSIFMVTGFLLLLFPFQGNAKDEIKDIDITRAIERNLLWEEAVSAHLIDVETDNGIVTLSGSVDNILARESAVEVAESIRGVRSIVNQIKVKPVTRTDEDIRKDIKQALIDDPVADSYEVMVKVDDGVVTLSGTVDSWTEQRFAGEVAKGIKGVRDIQNKINVYYKTERPDSEIKKEIERKLMADPYIDDLLITVNVNDGKVTLSGNVGSLAEKTKAYANAWTVLGVSTVDDDNLEVKWWLRDEMRRKDKFVSKSDADIKKAIEEALIYDPRTFSLNIDVEVSSRIVTLTGIVDNLRAKRAAEEDAKNTIGVTLVNNYLKVRPESPPSDFRIAENIKDALERDPLVDRFDITVTVLNKKAYLYGTVDFLFEKERAEDIASTTFGVVEVDNNIDIRPISWAWKSDEAIEDAIEGEFFWSIFVDGDDIAVSVKNGKAKLKGSVDDWGEYYAAVDNAFEGGALSVETNLDIEEYGTVHGNYSFPPIH
jgi:osmotically-inducible protein OsmY